MLKNYTEKYAEIWTESSGQFPVFSKSYSPTEKRIKEQYLDKFFVSVRSFRKDCIKRKSITPAEERLFFEDIRAFLHDGLDFSGNQLEIMFSDNLIEVTREFVRQARNFDPELSFSDIFQACRNAWIMHGLQLILGLPIQLTPSILAYSLLYPYTDNMIDDPKVSGLEKMVFSERFRDRLTGKKLDPTNHTEIAVFSLVEIIENEYSRDDFSEVFESLLGIHDAQTESMKLIHQKELLPEIETLKICLAKGGTSVLADGFLVAGHLTESQQCFLFGYGAYLQLLDDIQDVDEDYHAGLKTVFSKDAFRLPLDEKLNKTYWFGEQVMKSLDFFHGQHIDLFKSLMRRSMDLFVNESIAKNTNLYRPAFVSEFEKHSPFYFSFIRKRKEQFSPYNSFLLAAIEEIVFTEEFVAEQPNTVVT